HAEIEGGVELGVRRVVVDSAARFVEVAAAVEGGADGDPGLDAEADVLREEVLRAAGGVGKDAEAVVAAVASEDAGDLGGDLRVGDDGDGRAPLELDAAERLELLPVAAVADEVP